MVVKKTKLQLSDTSKEMLLLGIVSTEPGYKLVWHFNNRFDLSFQQTEQENEDDFPIYQCVDEWENEFSILTNKKDGASFLTGLKNVDFILKVCFDGLSFDDEEFKEGLKSTEGITAVLPIDEKNQKIIKKLC